MVGRLLITLLLLGVGVWSARSWSFLFSPSRIERSHDISTLDREDLHELLADNGGAWSFAGTGISADARQLPETNFKDEFKKGGRRTVFLAETADLENQIIQWLVNLDIPNSELKEGRIFESLLDDFGIYVETTQQDGSERINVARVGFRAGESWLLLELVFSSENVANEPESRHLLPVPKSAKRLCSRTASDGHLLIEVLDLEQDGPGLISAWEAAGWTVHQDSTTNAPFGLIHCQRDQEFVTALGTFKNSPEAVQLVLLNRTRIR